MVDVYNPRQVREEVGKLIKDIQEMENATNKLLESLMNAVSQTGDMDSVSERGYLMTLAQMQAVNNTVVCRVAKLLTLLVIWDSHNIDNMNLGEKSATQKPIPKKAAAEKPVAEIATAEKKPTSISERI